MAEDKLAKMHGLAHHLAKMAKAIGSFHQHMSKAHDAHAADMNASMEKLHKLVGITPGEKGTYGGGANEPEGTDLEAAGSTNLQTFPGMKSDDTAKATPVVDLAKAQPITRDEVKTAIQESMTDFMGAFVKAMTEPEPDSTGGSSLGAVITGQPQGQGQGIGDRRQMPVQRVVGAPVSKAQEAAGLEVVEQPVVVTPEITKRALNGDKDALRILWKGANPQATVPDTLVQPLSKVH